MSGVLGLDVQHSHTVPVLRETRAPVPLRDGHRALIPNAVLAGRSWGSPAAEEVLALGPAAPDRLFAWRQDPWSREFLRGLDWTTGEEGHYFADEIADALLEVRRHISPAYAVAALAPYARIAWRLSEAEFAQLPPGFRVPERARGDDIAGPSRLAILNTVLFERVFGALRRCANSMRSIRMGLGLPVPPAE